MSNLLEQLHQKAKELDQNDTLSSFRELFHFPKRDGVPSIYMCGNSLGLQPKSVRASIEQELLDWEQLAVEGHTKAKNPWFSYHELFSNSLAKLVGGKPTEVVAMNALTTNLHLAMASFYKPTAEKYKILIFGFEFPSDRYAVQTQAAFHSFDPDDAVIEIPMDEHSYISYETITSTIDQYQDELALILFTGVHYYSGQLFDIKSITEYAHSKGMTIGWDLAHTIGNIPLKLHDWNVDFAVWCTYKYLNSGPGGVGGLFVHERHCSDEAVLRLGGWWGNDPATRFTMPHSFVPKLTAESWQLSNAPVLSMAAHKASLEIFDSVPFEQLREKSIALTQFLAYGIETVAEEYSLPFHSITPSNPQERGCQISLDLGEKAPEIYKLLGEKNCVVDFRKPWVIRVAPTPLYNSFSDVAQFLELLVDVSRTTK